MEKNVSVFAIFTIAILFAGCAASRSTTRDAGVVINGVRWATRNVDTPGRFVRNPEDAGMFYQWNSARAWNATSEHVSGWGTPDTQSWGWDNRNDPCPQGWRVPTTTELHSLFHAGYVVATRNGINGRLFGRAPNQIFLPAAGWRHHTDGSLDSQGRGGAYWGATGTPPAVQANLGMDAWGIWFSIDPNWDRGVGTFWRASGRLIRCVAE